MTRRVLFPRGLLLALAPAALSAHVISMSTGYATVHGSTVEYIFRIPDYEMAHVKDTASLFDHIRFSNGGEDAVRTGQECHSDPANGAYLCASDYRFSRPVRTLDVECTLYQVTVPNHVHMLRAERDGKYDHAILDSSFPSATLAFRPPTKAEVAVEQTGAGFAQVLASGVQLVLLFSIALASRSRVSFAAAAGAFVAAQCGATLAALYAGWQPNPRLAESAAALALAYLALEMLVFPAARGRWAMAAMLGAFSGMYFNLFLSESGYSAGWVLAGAALASIICSGLMWAAMSVASRMPIRNSWRAMAARAAAMVLLCTGAVWFAVRLRS